MSKQAILLAVLLLASLLFCGIQTKPATAQSATPIHILPDGSIEPANTPLQIEGNIYKATANINTPIVVEKNNIVLDGQGYSIQGTGAANGQVAINLTCTAITVKNFHINGWQVGILGAFDNNKIVGNEFTGNSYDIAVYGKNYEIKQNRLCYVRIQGTNIHVTENEFHTRTYGSAFWISNSTGITIEANDFTLADQTTSFVSIDSNSNLKVYHNNFLSTLLPSKGQSYFFGMAGISDLEPWDDGYPSGGNYWSDFSVKYNNASMIDDSGIWNISYVITSNGAPVDRYPLCNPYEIHIAHVAPPPTSPITPSSSEATEDNPTPTVPEFSICALVLLFVTILLAVANSRKKFIGKPMDTVCA